MKFGKDSLILIFGEFFDRANFYGIQSILLLYLIQVFFFSQDNALTIYGVYSSLGFISPIVGGYFADKFLSRHRFILLGMIFILIGNCFLLFGTQEMFFFGLGSIITGISLFKSNNTVLFAMLYDATSAKKDAAFTFYYAAMNAGAIVGPFIYGTLEIFIGWKFGFIASIAGLSISLIFYLLRIKYIRQLDENTFEKFSLTSVKILATSLGLFFAIYLCFRYNQFFGALIWTSGFAVIGLLLYLIKPLTEVEKRKLLLLIVSMIFGMFFYAVSIQVSSSLLLYIDADVNTKVFGLTVPPEYFIAIYPLFIIMSTPVIAKIWQAQGITNGHTLIQRVNLSLYLAGFSFIILAVSTILARNTFNWQLTLIFVGLFVLGLGELAIGPIITSAITYLSPAPRQGIFMGLWYLLIGYSAYISSSVAKTFSVPKGTTHGVYLQNFLWVAIVTLIIAAAMTLMKNSLNKLCQN